MKRFYGGSYDIFQNAIISIIKKEPIEDDVKHYIITHLRFPKYYGVTLMMMELQSGDNPVIYEDIYYERQGNNAIKVEGVKGMKAVESRFNLPALRAAGCEERGTTGIS